MSGLVVGFGQPDRQKAKKMFDIISHRGTDLSGMWEHQKVWMAQNCLAADLLTQDGTQTVPAGDSKEDGARICFDGQIGNWEQLVAVEGVEKGPLALEQALLSMYGKKGAGLLEQLSDGIFAFVISDGEKLLAARDLLGIKTLFYGKKDGTLYFASELKSLLEVTEDVYEFPAGHYMDESGRIEEFARLPEKAPEPLTCDLDQMIQTVRDIIERSFCSRVHLTENTGGLLSGGMDSSVICCLANRYYKEKFGGNARLKTFALGVGESGDIKSARIVASHIGSDHHEVLVSLDQLLEALPRVIYYLESFDPSLVRSSVSNYLISRYAKEQGMDVLLSGEGGDEVFCGYTYLKQFPLEQLFEQQIKCMEFLHNNASLRLDRMNQCHSVRVVTPLISGELLNYVLRIPPEFKQKPDGGKRIEKWIFRKAYEQDLPESITWRLKQEFSQGTGSADLLPGYFENKFSDSELAEAQAKYPVIRSKEELYYFNIFLDHFGTGKAADTVGQWICL
jgi:asparagine synthase (glutamine-hydrolysing)